MVKRLFLILFIPLALVACLASGFPYLIIDTEEIDFRTEEGLDKVIEGIIHRVPGTQRLFG